MGRQRIDVLLSVRSDLRAVRDGVRVIQDAARQLRSIAGYAAGALGLAGGGYLFTKGIKEGIRFNAVLQDAKLGIAATQKALNPKAYATFSDALETASVVVDKIQKKALKSPAAFADLVGAFQGVTGAATEAGIKLEDQVDLVVTMSQALAGLGIRSDQILQESRALITGMIDRNALAAKILGITAADVKRAREEGKLYEFLSGKLVAFAEAGEVSATNYSVALSNLGDIVQQKLGIATRTLFAQLTKQILDLSDAIADSDLPERIDALIQDIFEQRDMQKLMELQFNLIVDTFVAAFQTVVAMAPSIFAGLGAALVKSFEQPLARIQAAMDFAFTKVRLRAENPDRYQSEVAGPYAAFEKANPVPAFGVFQDAAKTREVMARRRAEFKRLEAAFFQTSYDEMLKERMEEGVLFDFGSGAFNSDDMKAEARKKNVEGLQRVADIWRSYMDGLKTSLPLPRENAGAGEGGGTLPIKEQEKAVNLLELERDLKQKLLMLESNRARVEGAYYLTDAEKFKVRKAFLMQERQELQSIINLLQERASHVEGQEAEAIRTRLDAFNKQLVGKDTELARLGADPNSMGQSFAAEMTRLRGEFEVTALAIAQTLTGIIGGAVNSISDGITGIIMGTQTWGEALRNIGTSILTSIVQGIVNLGVRWIATQILIATTGKSIAAASSAALIPIAAAQSAVWAAPATLATIASYGGAAAAAPGLISAATAMTKASSLLGGFRKGGYTGDGDPSQVAGLVHKREVVIPADRAYQWGVGNLLSAIQTGDLSDAVNVPSAGRGASMASAGSGRPVNITVGNVDNSESAIKRFLSSSQGKTYLIDFIRSNRLEIGLNT